MAWKYAASRTTKRLHESSNYTQTGQSTRNDSCMETISRNTQKKYPNVWPEREKSTNKLEAYWVDRLKFSFSCWRPDALAVTIPLKPLGLALPVWGKGNSIRAKWEVRKRQMCLALTDHPLWVWFKPYINLIKIWQDLNYYLHFTGILKIFSILSKVTYL